MRRRVWMQLVLGVLGGVAAGCSMIGRSPVSNGAPQAATSAPAAGSPREITGDEALRLYGVDVNSTPTAAPATATPQIWFPARAWVEPAVMPYDLDETIDFLPMFSRPTLDEEGTWLGDLEAGTEVVLHAISEDGSVCLVEGRVLQGWTTRGWVACNRLTYIGPE